MWYARTHVHQVKCRLHWKVSLCAHLSVVLPQQFTSAQAAKLCAPCVGYAGHYTFPFTACDTRDDSVSRFCAAPLGSAAEQISLLTSGGQVRPTTPAPLLLVLQKLGIMFALIKVLPCCLLALLFCLSACLQHTSADEMLGTCMQG